jgi:hypothetical protein
MSSARLFRMGQFLRPRNIRRPSLRPKIWRLHKSVPEFRSHPAFSLISFAVVRRQNYRVKTDYAGREHQPIARTSPGKPVRG